MDGTWSRKLKSSDEFKGWNPQSLHKVAEKGNDNGGMRRENFISLLKDADD